MSIDPLAEKYSYQSPYNFSENRVVDSRELEGLEAVSVTTKSFAPYNTFGGGFSGDGANAKFSTSPTATARVQNTVNVDFNKSKPTVSGGLQTSDPSHHPLLGSDTAPSRNALTNVSIGENSAGNKQVSFKSDLKGANPLIYNAPNIDVNAIFSMSSNQETNVLSISAYASGDKFPSAESFITDSAGNSVFIGVSKLEGSPANLVGEGNKKMFTADMQIKFDSNGNFLNVTRNGTTKSLTEDKKDFEKLSPK